MATINLDSTTLPTQLPTYEGKCCRGEHGQDQDWISCRILAIFSDQDWIWILIFEKNLMRRGYLFDLYNEISWESIKKSEMMVVVLSFFIVMVYVFTKNQNYYIRKCCTHHSQ